MVCVSQNASAFLPSSEQILIGREGVAWGPARLCSLSQLTYLNVTWSPAKLLLLGVP